MAKAKMEKYTVRVDVEISMTVEDIQAVSYDGAAMLAEKIAKDRIANGCLEDYFLTTSVGEIKKER